MSSKADAPLYRGKAQNEAGSAINEMVKELTRQQIYEAKEQWRKSQVRLPYSRKLDIWATMRKQAEMLKQAPEQIA